jgi:hypothetical protein
MRAAILVSIFVIAPWSGAVAGQSASSDPVLRVGVFGYKADGGVSLAAWDPQPSTNSIVYIKGLCEVGGGAYQVPPARATDAWRFSGKVLNITPEEALVEVDWRRIMDKSQAVTAPAGTIQVTVRIGEKIVLDHVFPDELPGCSVTAASFEVRYDESPTRVVGAGSGRASGGGTEKPRGGGVASSGGGRLIIKPRLTATATNAASKTSADLPAAFYDVNLWLVHSAPGRPDEVLHQALRAPRLGAPFAFSPVTVDTPRGPMIVQVTGSLAIETGTSGEEQLVFVTNRRLTSTRFDAAVRDAPPASQGGSRTRTAMPKPDDVLSFEMPPLRVREQGAAPDQFAVRVRITAR